MALPPNSPPSPTASAGQDDGFLATEVLLGFPTFANASFLAAALPIVPETNRDKPCLQLSNLNDRAL
jgi:hypothetical protein